MGWASYLEDILERRYAIEEELPKLKRACLSAKDKRSLLRVEAIIRCFESLVGQLDSLIDFLTDPANENAVNSVLLKWEKEHLTKEVKRSRADIEIVEARGLKKITELRQIINEFQRESEKQKKEIAKARRESKVANDKLNLIFEKHPDIAYDLYPPKNPYKTEQ